MSSLKNVWIVSSVLIVVLFLFFVYPRLESFGNMPAVFQWVFRVLVFIAILSFTIFILVELKNWHSRCLVLERVEESKKSTTDSDSEDMRGLGLSLKIDPEKNYKEVTNQISKIVQSSLMAQTAFIYLFNESESHYTLQGFHSSIDVELAEQFIAEGSLFGEYHLSAQPINYNTSELDEEKLIYYKVIPKVGSLMIIPIRMSKGQFVGFLGLDSADKEAWGEEDLELASSFTNMFSISVWQIDVIDRQKNHIQFFQDVNKLNISLSLGVEQLDFYKVAANLSRKFFDFDKLTIAILKNEQEKELLIEYIDGYEADYGIGHQITVMGGLWENLIIKGQPVMVSDYDESDIEFRFQPGDKESFPFRSCLGIPLMVGRKRFGGLLLESFSTGNFLPEVAETLIFFGKNLSEMINRMNIYQSMKDLAMIDGLTGICNHRAFKERLQVEIDRCRRYGSTMTLFILDLDKFKRINDTYGHLYGDFVLKKISNIIRGSVRTVDTVARYGGEEFAVILINSDKKGCFNTAERIRSNIQSFLFEKDGMSERMTISIGMSEYPADGDDLQAIIANADMAMYQSKRDGGNKVVMYNPELES